MASASPAPQLTEQELAEIVARAAMDGAVLDVDAWTELERWGRWRMTPAVLGRVARCLDKWGEAALAEVVRAKLTAAGHTPPPLFPRQARERRRK